MRKIEFIPGYVKHPAGSCLACFGETKVLCTASIENRVPPFITEESSGWLTAEYSMLPGSTIYRKRRDGTKKDGRSTEIQRLIGRSLRAAVKLDSLGPITITVDCDVIQADGGTRTTAISGGWVALVLALNKIANERNENSYEKYLNDQIAAVSVGLVNGKIVCDLDYANDKIAEVDMNVVKRADDLVEVQGAGENGIFTRDQLNRMLDSADEGIRHIYEAQLSSIKKFLQQ